MTIRVLVADDQDIVRAGLVMILDAQAMILDAQADITVIGEAANGREAISTARELRPDVCLLDIRMPEIDGIEATRQLAGADIADPIPVVVITTFDLDEYVYGALKAGARGFLLKDAGPELLTQAIHAAAQGDALIAPNITTRLLAAFADTHRASPPPQPGTPHRKRRTGSSRRRPRAGQHRDRRAVHQPQHRQDAHRRAHAQAQRPQPRRDRHMGLRNRPHQDLNAAAIKREESMVTFQEKSTLTITSIQVVVFGAYFALVLGPVAASPDREHVHGLDHRGDSGDRGARGALAVFLAIAFRL